MLTSINAQQLSTLLRISSGLNIVGDVTTTVDNPSALLAWAHALPEPIIRAWRAEDSGNRYVEVSATCHRTPLHGRVTAVLIGDNHHEFWTALVSNDDLAAGDEQLLPLSALVATWSAISLEPGAANMRPVVLRPLATPEGDSRDATT